MSRHSPVVAFWMVVAFAASTLGLSGLSMAASIPAAPSERIPGADWPMHGGDSDEQRYSSLTAIDENNANRIGLAWSYQLDTSRGQEATPLVVGGILYTSTAWSKVIALDGASGKLLWEYDPHVPGKVGFSACCDVVNRGVAYDNGRIFVGTLDGRLQALSAKTGRLLWTTMTVDPTKPYTISGAPRVMRGKVVIGNGGADYGVRGYVTAYAEDSGRLIWRFYTVPGDPAKPDHAASDAILESLARPTWFGDEYIRTGGGGTVWDSIVYDSELNRLYIGVGNGSPDNHNLRSEGKGDNLFLSSVVALDPDTGKYLWHYQETPGESWDYTSTQQMTLTELPVAGVMHKVLLHAPKNGFFYVLDRDSGKLLSAEKFAPVNWADRIDTATGRPVENPDARYIGKPFLSTAGGIGAHNWQAMSFDPKTRLVYIPVQLVPALYNQQIDWTFRPGRWNLGFDMMRSALPTRDADRKAMLSGVKGWLSAWDPVTQKEVWRVNYAGAWNGGTLSTAGGLVFQGNANHEFAAYRAVDGKKLWSFLADAAIMAAPVTYSVGGQQYVAVLSGGGGAFSLALPAFDGPGPVPNGRVLAFSLGGTSSLPVFRANVSPITAVNVSASAETIESGRILFADNCGACHGMGGWSSGIIPNLHRSAALKDAQAWKTIVYDGALQSKGMIGFKDYMTAAQVESIRAFLAKETQTITATGGASGAR